MNFLSSLKRWRVSPESWLVIAVVAVVVAMVVPLPTWAVDVGLALSLMGSVLVVAVATQAQSALSLASFPGVLLVMTLLRLSLNVSSTRLALSEGHAGQVIEAFGEFVVRGDYVVGAVVFAVLTIIQLVVVTKGSERVAEVSARFTLDAMPGKQMAIDADLRAGLINQTQARDRRRALEREAQLFGAMDGAMKFIKGDVVAGLIIVVVNLVGGIVIGTTQSGMNMSEAAATYALIAIGDGLASQIPSLCLSVAAAVLVTRVAAEKEGSNPASELAGHLFRDRRVWLVVGTFCGCLALLPAMPALVFGVLSALSFLCAWRCPRWFTAQAVEAADPQDEAPEGTTAPVGYSAPIQLELGRGWTSLMTGKGWPTELKKVSDLLFAQTGVRAPAAQLVIDSERLEPSGYCLWIHGVPATQAAVDLDKLFTLKPAHELRGLTGAQPFPNLLPGRSVTAVPAVSVREMDRAAFQLLSPVELLREILTAALRKRVADFLGIQETQQLIELLEPQAPVLVKEVLQKVPLPLLSEVLRRLAREDVSIQHAKLIFEALAHPHAEGDAAALAERCRQSLHRYFSHRYAPRGALYAYLVDPAVEEALRGGEGVSLDPEVASSILRGAVKVFERSTEGVVLTAADVRAKLKRLLEGTLPSVAVLTYAELDAELSVRPVGKLAAA